MIRSAALTITIPLLAVAVAVAVALLKPFHFIHMGPPMSQE